MASPHDPLKLAFKLYRHLTHLTRVRPEHPGLTAWSRGVVLLVGLGVGGPVLWHGLTTMPVSLWIVLLLGLGLRVARWLWHRTR